MQLQLVLVLKRGIKDKSMISIQLSFCSPNACIDVFNSNVPIFHSNCADSLHFSAFFIKIVLISLRQTIIMLPSQSCSRHVQAVPLDLEFLTYFINNSFSYRMIKIIINYYCTSIVQRF